MVGLLLVTHGDIGDSLLRTAKSILGDLPTPVATLSVNYFPDIERLIGNAKEQISALDQGQGVLILTDLFGATPHNIAEKLGEDIQKVAIVSGLNLSMLLRTLNYNNASLKDLSTIAAAGGVKGITCHSHPRSKTRTFYAH